MSQSALVELSRWQWALTASFHVTFPAVTVGTSVFLIVCYGAYMRSPETRSRAQRSSRRYPGGGDPASDLWAALAAAAARTGSAHDLRSPLPAASRGAARDGGRSQRHRVESWNRVNAVIAYGNGGDIPSNHRDEQELVGLCIRILQAALVFVNTLMLQDVLAGHEWEGVFNDADRRGLTPLFWLHILPWGEIRLDMNQRLQIAEQDAGSAPAEDWT